MRIRDWSAGVCSSALHESAPDRTYKIGHAVSTDGVGWIKEEARQIITNRLGEDESQALPTVNKLDDRHHMFFCYRQSFDCRPNAARGYRLGHAWRSDGRRLGKGCFSTCRSWVW